MAFTIIGFTESFDSATLQALTAMADAHVRVVGDDVVVPDFAPNMIQAYALGPSVTQAQLRSPSLRATLNPEIVPLDRSTLPASPVPIASFRNRPVPLEADEALNVFASEDGVTTRVTAIVWLEGEREEAPAGSIFTVRVTNAATLTANVWTNGALTFDQTLPKGRYALVGARFRSTDMQAFRFVFAGTFFRPGGIGADAVGDLEPMGQRFGGWGNWGVFTHNVPPTVDFLANAGNTSQTGELDLIKVE